MSGASTGAARRLVLPKRYSTRPRLSRRRKGKPSGRRYRLVTTEIHWPGRTSPAGRPDPGLLVPPSVRTFAPAGPPGGRFSFCLLFRIGPVERGRGLAGCEGRDRRCDSGNLFGMPGGVTGRELVDDSQGYDNSGDAEQNRAERLTGQNSLSAILRAEPHERQRAERGAAPVEHG